MLGWKIFSFRTLCTFSLLSGFDNYSRELSCQNCCCSFSLFCSWLLLDFSLSLIISSFTTIHLGMVFFAFILLGICDTSWVSRLKSYTLDEKHSVSHHILYLFYCFTSFWDSNYTYIRPFNSVLYIFYVVSIFPFHASVWIFSADSFSNSLIFSALSNLVKFTYWKLNLLFYISVV